MGKNYSGNGKIREAIINGIFYPDNENELKANIKKLLDASETRISDAFAIISPHAGYNYAGKCIASAFKSVLKRKIKNIVILAPMHNDPVDQIILPESKYFLTPLGSIKVNRTLVDEILSCSTGITVNDIPHLGECCIETQLPFIRYLFPEANIVPIILGKPTDKNIRILANALQLTFANSYSDTLFIATSNMTAYIKGQGSEQEAELLISLIEAKDAEGIKQAMIAKKISSAGAGCIATLLSFRNLQYRVEVLHRNCSTETNNDPDTLVHYAALALNIE